MTPTAPLSQPGPEDAGPQGGAAAFGRLVETALRTRAVQDPIAPLRRGELAPQALCRYAAGRLPRGERGDVESTLQRHPGALGLVTSLVRGARPDSGSPLARTLVEAAREGQVEPRRAVALALLAARGAGEAHAAATRGDKNALERAGDDPLARAACHLVLGDIEQARAAFDAAGESDDALVAAARQVAAADDEDEALIALLATLA